MRSYIIASILIILGLISTTYQGSLAQSHWLKPYFNEFSSVLLVSGLLSLLYKIFQDSDSDRKIRKLFRIHDSVEEFGLLEIVAESQGYNFTEVIEECNNLTVVINDGLRWAGNYTVSLKKRMSKRGTVTEIFTVDPDGPFLNALANKIDTSPESLKKKIDDNWRRLQEIYEDSEKKGTLIIYSLKNYPTRTIFLTESKYIETPYQVSSGRTNVPVFVYEKNHHTDSLFGFVERDLQNVRAESKQIFHSRSKQ